MSRTPTRRQRSREAQYSLPGFDFKKSFAFGGSGSGSVAGKTSKPRTGNPKTARYIDPKGILHLVLRSTLAKGDRSFLLRDRAIRRFLYDQAAGTGVAIRRFANAGNHLHMLVSPHSRRSFRKFIRASTGLIARKTLGAERNSPWRTTAPGRATERTSPVRFWDARPFTRIVTWGRDYNGVKNYLELNRVEVATGLDRGSARGLLKELERRTAGLTTGFG